MRRENMNFLLKAITYYSGPIADAVKAAKVQDTVNAQKLMEGLTAAKFDVQVKTSPSGNRTEVRVFSGKSGIMSPKDTRDGNTVSPDRLVAFSNSESLEEAILHAMLGYFRECHQFAPIAEAKLAKQ